METKKSGRKGQANIEQGQSWKKKQERRRRKAGRWNGRNGRYRRKEGSCIEGEVPIAVGLEVPREVRGSHVGVWCSLPVLGRCGDNGRKADERSRLGGENNGKWERIFKGWESKKYKKNGREGKTIYKRKKVR
jgi:hypothetical protein